MSQDRWKPYRFFFSKKEHFTKIDDDSFRYAYKANGKWYWEGRYCLNFGLHDADGGPFNSLDEAIADSRAWLKWYRS